MACDETGTCVRVQYKVRDARFVHIEPRPRSDAPGDLEQILLQRVHDALESDHDDCTEGCECVIGEPVEVASRQMVKEVTEGEYTAWYQLTLVKYRTPGECMPASDELPEAAR